MLQILVFSDYSHHQLRVFCMLIEFSVSNFRSIREKQTLSMVAASRLSKKQNVFKPSVPGEKLPPLLKIAAIYGPNASGKSSIVKALGMASWLTGLSPSTQTDQLHVSPFRFDPALADKPSEFEFHFINNNLRYEFSFGLTTERITSERLISYPKGKETLLYERTHTPNGDEYVFGEHLEGGPDLHNVWKNLTGSQSFFISQAVANSSESLNQLRTPFKWLREFRTINSEHWDGWTLASRNLANKHSTFTAEISSFLQEVDVPVTKIKFEQLEESLENIKTKNRSTDYMASPNYKTILTHKTALGEADFDFNEESSGTKNLIGFWLPWSLLAQTPKTENRILVIDELDSSLHPKLVADLVAKHIELDTHTQVIFTTHDTHLMNTKLLRRDQFWLTERDINGATQLRSLHDFAGREGEDIEKRYYEGRYRSLPFLRRT